MSFCRNTEQQISMTDSVNGLTARERKRLQDSWAEKFHNDIFPLINEGRFSVLYSDNPASRPNGPVNVRFGLLILKEIFGQSDEEAVDSLIFDVRYQHALHTGSMQEQPISKNSLSNFRRLVYEYMEKTGRDLVQEEVESHAREIRSLMKIKGDQMRMDSMMISSSCRTLTRLELIYSCVSRMIMAAYRTSRENIPETCLKYLEAGHHNDIIYRSRNTDVMLRINEVMNDAHLLLKEFAGSKAERTEEYELLKRMVNEQTAVNADGESILKDSKDIEPDSLHNPSDPDAAYRTKGGKKYIGYVANIKEDFNGTDSVITHYDLQKATYSDPSFCRDMLQILEEEDAKGELFIDGAYYSDELSKKAKTQGIEMFPSGIVGREAAGDYSLFEIDEENHLVIKCFQGHEPEKQQFENGIYKAYFAKSACTGCPFLSECPVKEQKRRFMLKTAEIQYHTAKLKKRMKTAEYIKKVTKRAGIEGIPSVMRRKYQIDHLPVRGQVRLKTWFGLKIEAINVLRYCRQEKRHRKQKARKSKNGIFRFRAIYIFRTIVLCE